MEENKKRAELIISRFGIQGEIIFHEKSGKTTEQAEEALGIHRSHILKCLLFKSKKSYLAVIITGDKRVDFKKLKHLSKSKSLRLATPNEVKELTRYKVGSVPPFVVFDICQTFVDLNVMKKSFVIGAAGSEYAGIKFNPEELTRFNMTVADLTENFEEKEK